jgi:hypothetical protein
MQRTDVAECPQWAPGSHTKIELQSVRYTQQNGNMRGEYFVPIAALIKRQLCGGESWGVHFRRVPIAVLRAREVYAG